MTARKSSDPNRSDLTSQTQKTNRKEHSMRALINITAIFLCVLTIQGCAPTVWKHPHDSQSQFNIDSDVCLQISNGMTPTYQPPSRIEPTYIPPSYNTNCRHVGNNLICDTTPNFNAYNQAQIISNAQNAGAQIGHGLSQLAAEMNKKRIYENCMFSRGYYKEK